MNRIKKEPYVNQGFKPNDQNYLRKYDNPKSDPQIQLFTDEDLDEEPEDKQYFCAMCKTRLDYYSDLEEWFCSGCMQHYDTKIQDKPIADISDFKLVPHSDLLHYPQFDDNDPRLAFVANIDVDKLAGEEDYVELVKSSPDTRVKHIKVKGSPVQAISAMNEADKKQ